ncbi:MAG: DMT family transporter [Myxococcota bacterium]
MTLPTGHLLGVAAALASALAWAVGSILFRRIGERASPSAMNLVKSLVGLVLLGGAVLVTGVTRVDAESLWRLAASGVLGIAVGDTLFFTALVRLEPRLTLLLATVGHVFTVVLAAVVFDERPGALAWVGIALVVAGVGWVLQAGAEPGQVSGEGRTLGLVCGVLSAFATSTGLLLAKTGVAEVSTLEATWIRLGAGVLGVALWSAARGQLAADLGAVRVPGLVREIAVAVAVVMFGGFWLSLVSLKYTHASVATALAATEPIFILPLARFWLGERVGARAIVGACGAVAGVVLILLAMP